MEDPLVSVVIPTYNRAKMVVEAVRSALGQTVTAMEVIVVDDGSRDDTEERLSEFGNRIEFYVQQNQGVSAARNAGIGHATGEYIAFLDSDDVWHPRKLEMQIAHFQHHPDLALLACRSGRLNEEIAHGAWPSFADAELSSRPVRLDE